MNSLPRTMLLMLAAACCATVRAGDAAEARVVTYRMTAGDTELGTETIRFDALGLGAAARLEYPGGAFVFREAILRREGDALQWRHDAQVREGRLATAGSIEDDRWRWADDHALAPQELALGAADFVFPDHHDLVAGLAHALRGIAAAASAGRDVVGLEGAAVLPDLQRVERVVVTHAKRIPDQTRGGDAWLLRLRLRYDSGREVAAVCEPDGMPVCLRLATAGLEARRVDFQSPPLPDVRSTALGQGPWRSALSQVRHDQQRDPLVMVPMRDGVKLATLVYRPRREGRRFPAILIRTPYHIGSEALQRPGQFVRRGYGVVIQDVRGRGDSEGAFDPMRHEEADGVDTLDWLVAQPWCDGRVGMIGQSYVGWVQLALAKSAHPALKAVVPVVCPPDPDQNFPYEGGVMLLAVAWWAAVMDSMDENGFLYAAPDLDWMDVFGTLPLGDLDASVGTRHRFVDEWIAHPPDDEEYWGPLRHENAFPRMKVAALHVSGWFDGDQPGALRNFAGLRARCEDEAARDAQFLIMGPWGHAPNLLRRMSGIDLGDEAVVDLDAVVLRFFDRYLKGIRNGFDEEERVWLFTLGANRWRRGEAWPPEDAVPTPLFLDVDAARGLSNRREGGGRLALDAAPAGAAPSTFEYDPLDPREVPVEFNDFVGESALDDYSVAEDADSVLDFTSPPLAEPLELTGPLELVLHVATDAADTDFAAELFKMTPDGAMRLLGAGIQRLRYRNGPGRDDPVPPGQEVEITLDLWATSTRLDRGDRLALQVGSTSFPGAARNLNTLEPPLTAVDAVVARQTVFHDAVRRSRLVVPVAGGTRAAFGEE